MGREVRMVPADWQHPTHTEETAPEQWLVGRFIPLHDGNYANAAAEWDEANQKWEEGLRENYGLGPDWVPKSEHHTGTYEEYAGARPKPEEYMPDWSDEQRTHFMMYEDTSEGTPISPAFATADELARWLADTGASAFADMTATYEEWLATIHRGSAISAVLTSAGMVSGVAAFADEEIGGAA